MIGAGRVLCVTGASGAGKGTVVAALLKRHGDIALSVSTTTRKKRVGEIDGVDYHFVRREEFDALESLGEFVETTEIYGNRYGTTFDAVDEIVESGRTVMLELDTRGARFVAAEYPHAIIVYLRAPSVDEQRKRLMSRGARGADLERRLAESVDEDANAVEFGHVVTNDVLADTISNVESILFR